MGLIFRSSYEVIPFQDFMLGTITVHADLPLMEALVFGGGLTVAALGLTILEKHTDFNVDKAVEIFGQSLPIIVLFLLGWFLIQLTTMFGFGLW